MLALKIFVIFLLVALAGFFVSFLWYLLLGPLVFKGIFKADLDDINEKRKCEECVKMDFDKWDDIYCLNTKKWSLGCLPSCRIDTTRQKFGEIIITSNYWNHNYCVINIYVDFGFIGNLKYSRWRHKYLKNKKTKETQEREVKNLYKIHIEHLISFPEENYENSLNILFILYLYLSLINMMLIIQRKRQIIFFLIIQL